MFVCFNGFDPWWHGSGHIILDIIGFCHLSLSEGRRVAKKIAFSCSLPVHVFTQAYK